jgi:cobalt-zinc-cadmium resistance protein CzcA
VFLVQWIFLGNLRSALIVGANIPFALLFSLIILVLTHQDANLLSIGAVDFGIIVDGAVILVENIFRNFQGSSTQRTRLIEKLHEGAYGPNVTEQTLHGSSRAWTDRLRLIYISALQVDRSVMFSVAITVAAFIPLFTMQGLKARYSARWREPMAMPWRAP